MTDKKRKAAFLLLFLLSIFLIWMLGYSVYRASERAIEQNYQTTYRVALKNSGRVLDMNLRSIIEVVRGFLNDRDLQQVLGKREQLSSTFPAKDRKVLEEAARQLARLQAWVNDVIFMDLSGNHFMLSNTRGSYEFDLYYNEHDFRREEWSRKAAEALGKEVFFGENVLGPDLGNVLCMTKYLINPSTGEPMGYLAVTLSRTLLTRSYVGGGGTDQPKSNYLVLDTEDAAVYYDGRGEEEENVRNAFLSFRKTGKPSAGLIFSDVENETTGWKLVNAAKLSELSAESRQLRNMVWLVGGIVLVFTVMLIRLLLANQRLSGHLMATKLNEREAELLLLQSQINPHFLYNTLDALYFQAIIDGDDRIADMTMALSNHFKLTLNNGNKFISIRDSLRWIREYMKIMNMRYHDRFELVEQVDPSLLDKEILTFILQPFVENAMNHGLEAKIGKGTICVAVRQDGENLILRITDDGAGMEDVSLWESGYGVRNVQERIRLYYGEAYGASVWSRRNEGTRVTVTLPAALC